jgi:hypothetical protein
MLGFADTLFDPALAAVTSIAATTAKASLVNVIVYCSQSFPGLIQSRMTDP